MIDSIATAIRQHVDGASNMQVAFEAICAVVLVLALGIAALV